MLYKHEFEPISNAEGLKLSLSSGALHLRLKVIDEITSAAIRLKNAGMESGKIGTGRLSRAMEKTSKMGDTVANQLNENGDLFQDIGSLLLKLDAFAKVAGDFAVVRFRSLT